MEVVPFLLIMAMFTLNPITLSVYPQFSLSRPATFRLAVLTPRHTDNRNVCLDYRLVGDADPVRSSCQSMDGANGARVRTVYWDVRAAGEYEAVATLTRMEAGRERLYVDRRSFRVGMEP